MTHAPPHVRFLQCSFTTLRSGQTLVQELPQTPLPEQSAAVHLAPAVVSALLRLTVQLLDICRAQYPLPLSRGKPVNESGRQEFLENLINQFIYANIAAVYPPPPQVTAC